MPDMEMYNGIPAVSAKSWRQWRKWLEQNHAKAASVWLIIYRKAAETPSVYYEEAVEQALCFGWIDSKPNKRDESSYYQFFTKRNPKSAWSKINKKRIEKLEAAGQMTDAGRAMVLLAKEKGTWNALDQIDQIQVPEDLKTAFDLNESARKNFEAFPPSSKKIILEWIMNAKRSETRQKRIEDTVLLAAQNVRANHYRQ